MWALSGTEMERTENGVIGSRAVSGSTFQKMLEEPSGRPRSGFRAGSGCHKNRLERWAANRPLSRFTHMLWSQTGRKPAANLSDTCVFSSDLIVSHDLAETRPICFATWRTKKTGWCRVSSSTSRKRKHSTWTIIDLIIITGSAVVQHVC